MFLPLALILTIAAPPTPAPTAGPTDPPVRIRLSDDEFFLGSRAKVRVRAEQDGYLLVLRMDGQGRVRVLFPLNPDDSATIKGGKEFEVKSRGDRDAFVVDESTGVGTVLAAVSSQPFDFAAFARGRHWDYRTLADSTDINDPETSLLDIVDRMSPTHYEYDAVKYTVIDGRNYPMHARYYGPSYYGAGYYDPWYNPFGFWGPRSRFGFGVGFGGFHHSRRRFWW